MGNKSLSNLFAFMKGLGCEKARTFLFNKILEYKKSYLSFYIVQIDLPSAYNSVNLALLK
jgi:hypothetical protein